MFQAQNDASESAQPIVIESIEITVFQAKGAVESVIRHKPVSYKTEACDGENQPVVATHTARRFERAAACPVATGRALFELAQTVGVPSTLRFA